MQAARYGKVDLIITKRLSRFGRNTLDCLINIRELKALGVDVYFERENVHVLRSEGEMLLTLIAAVAQNESLNQSDNVKWGIRRQYERGNVKSVQASKFLGYKKNKQGDLVIDEAQAVTVLRIYQLFLEGLGVYQIATQFANENVPMAYGGKEWCASHILKVLKNEKYMGDTRFQKTFNANYLTKRRVKNTGQLPQYNRENAHPAIINRETWELVQQEMARQKQYVESHQMDTYHHHSQEIPLSGKIICGECGRILLLRKTNRDTYENSKYWRCVTRHGSENACGSQLRLDMDVANQSLITAWHELISQRDQLDLESDSKLVNYRRYRLKILLQEHGPIKVIPYDLLLQVLDHIETHDDYLTVVFLAGIKIRVNRSHPDLVIEGIKSALFRGKVLDENLQHDPFMLLFRFLLIKFGYLVHYRVIPLLITAITFVEFVRIQAAMGGFVDHLARKLYDHLKLAMQVLQFGIDAGTVT